MPTAVPFARTCSGKISGTYTHGMQLAVEPKISMYTKKKATEAVAVFTPVSCEYSLGLNLKLSRTEINIMLIARPRLPHIIGLRRPMRSRKKVGMREPKKNLRGVRC